MSTTSPGPRPPLSDPLDRLLADVAVRVQLSRTNHDKAVGRYQAVNGWIERDGSLLKDRVELFYPQGSMAIDATIASKLRTDEFDIDVVAQLDLPPDVSPQAALDLLYTTIKGEPGSRYNQMTKRRSRCVTVDYSDNMHLDVTPTLRRWGNPERESWIFHHRAEAPREPSYRCIANPYGFAEWFKRVTPPDLHFAEVFEARARDYERLESLLKAAESEPVPPQKPAFQKSKAVIVLQLLKRWRNVQYDTRSGRRPPSIMIAKLVADAANHTDRLSEELLLQAQHMLSLFRQHHNQGRLVRVVNPVCIQDVLTDRWPGSLQDQAVFIHDLVDLSTKIERLISGCDLGEMRRIMEELFGEKPTADTFSSFNEDLGRAVRSGQSRHQTESGRVVVPSMAVAGAIAPAVAHSTPKHTFYGGEDRAPWD